MNLHQREHNNQLNYQIIKTITNRYEICPHFIDLFNSSNYKGKRHMHNGRTIIQLPNKQGQSSQYIIIDKDHSTRYLVEKIISYSEVQNSNQQFLNITLFQGYKMQLNKYMIHGFFQLFEMKSYSAYFGFQYIQPQDQSEGRHLLFCKLKSNEQIIKYYFDKQLNCIQQTKYQEQQILASDYFSQSMSDPTLQKLIDNDFLSTKVINYFFQRLMFSYYSKFWNQDKLPFIKIFQSQSLASFFFCKQQSKLDFTYFQNRLFNIYEKISKNALSEQQLIIFPIFQLGQAHFVLGIIKVDNQLKKIFHYELDPLDSPYGTWRGKLNYFIKYNQKMDKQNKIPHIQYQKLFHKQVKSIQAPRQLSSSDCGIYICLYALLIMGQHSLVKLHKELKEKCSENEKSRQLIHYIRVFLYQSYKHRDMYFLDGFQNKFERRFNQLRQISKNALNL